ncbi:hypothetical protein NAPIS_ORF01075 [Vairimorpha apis BRL 01]|uniref:Uncharacterized protein n=1 Tax=Vairimorpha apis BRL 01 TaxID=1037528 RepID=T0L1D1_9MICR|nr:hypothetical protein NAPIS_ORF01075 [Vairimorpha apis BRL 01]
MDTKISTNIKVNHNKPDIFVLDKKSKENFNYLFTIVENEKLRNYDLLAYELEIHQGSLVLKKTLESISLKRRRRHNQGDAGEEEIKPQENNKSINNNRGKILDPEDLTSNNECEIKETHIISSVPEHETFE